MSVVTHGLETFTYCACAKNNKMSSCKGEAWWSSVIYHVFFIVTIRTKEEGTTLADDPFSDVSVITFHSAILEKTISKFYKVLEIVIHAVIVSQLHYCNFLYVGFDQSSLAKLQWVNSSRWYILFFVPSTRPYLLFSCNLVFKFLFFFCRLMFPLLMLLFSL